MKNGHNHAKSVIVTVFVCRKMHTLISAILRGMGRRRAGKYGRPPPTQNISNQRVGTTLAVVQNPIGGIGWKFCPGGREVPSPGGEGGPEGRMRNAGRNLICGTRRYLFRTVSLEEVFRFPKPIGYLPHSSSAPSGHLPPGGRDCPATWAEASNRSHQSGFGRPQGSPLRHK